MCDKLKIKVLDSKIDVYWSLTVENEDCPICKKNLLEISPSTTHKQNIILVGTCNHGIHKECMEKWKNQLNTKLNILDPMNQTIFCPIDKLTWFQKDEINPNKKVSSIQIPHK